MRPAFLFLFLLLLNPMIQAEYVEVSDGIELAANYIINNTIPEGRLAYERHINPNVLMDPLRYNVLRHAGTIYAASLYEQNQPRNPAMHATRVRLAEYLLKKYLKKLEGGMYAIVSDPQEEELPEPLAKIGASGLALIGISDLVHEGMVSLEILRGLGNFVLYMQKEDGSFYAKYIYSSGVRDDSFISMYYPGEAALGLQFLYEVDPQEKWLTGCKKALLFLADTRKDLKEPVDFDHWAMLATQKLFENPKNGLTSDEKARLLFHARQMADWVLTRVVARPGNFLDGSVASDLKTCSNGTKMEGMCALYFIFQNDPVYKSRILAALDRMCGFLKRAQVREEYLQGGFPSSSVWRFPDRPKKEYIVRIDNVQHIMSAWLNYRNIYAKQVE